jgi:hypothetical protein
MTLKVPTVVTKEWVREHCLCVRRENRLLCVESCPVHNSYDVPASRRDAIEEATSELGWRLDWYMEKPAEKRP